MPLLSRLCAALSFAAIALLASTAAKADTVYSYTGQHYVTNEGPFTTSESVTGSFTVASALASNLALSSIAPLSYSFNDGNVTLTQANSTYSNFEVATSATGLITNYLITLTGTGTVNNEIINIGNDAGVLGVDFVADHTTGLTDASDSPGHFSAGVTTGTAATTPEPSTLLLLGTGILSLAEAARRR